MFQLPKQTVRTLYNFSSCSIKSRISTRWVHISKSGLIQLLEKEIATHSSILAWEIPWTEGPGGLWSMGFQRVRRDLAIKSEKEMTTQSSVLAWRIPWTEEPGGLLS